VCEAIEKASRARFFELFFNLGFLDGGPPWDCLPGISSVSNGFEVRWKFSRAFLIEKFGSINFLVVRPLASFRSFFARPRLHQNLQRTIHNWAAIMKATSPLYKKITRLALNTKQTNKGFYKGTGTGSTGRHTKHGGYIIEWEKVRTYVVPKDLKDFKVCYSAAHEI
jgi:hypothetical protein